MTVEPSDIPPPLALIAELTHRCPLRCLYCSNPLDLVRRGEELSTDNWCAILDEAADMGIVQVHFTGGEPAARDDLEVLVGRAEDRGMYVNLITSAVALDGDRLRRLNERGLSHVQISFQGADEETAASIAGFDGGHDQKCRIARQVRELDMALTVNAVIHRSNMDQVPELIQLALDLDAQRLEIANVQYYGWALANRETLLPTRAQAEAVAKTVEQERLRLKGRLVIDHVAPDYYARRPKACMGGWGRQSLNIMPDGRVLPCHAAATIPELAFERAGDRPLLDIWRHGAAFERFRGTQWMAEPCRSCPDREVDWGGCRCQALALTGNTQATDPACELAPYHHLMAQLAGDQTGAYTGSVRYRSMSGKSD